MLNFIIIFLITANGITNAQNCSERIESVCNFPFYIGNVPDSVEEFKQVCNQKTTLIDCGFRYESKCTRDSSMFRMLLDLRSLLEEVCSDYTLLNAALIDNFECLKREIFDIENYACENPNGKEKRRQAENLYTKLVTNNVEDEDPFNCLDDFGRRACAALYLEIKCGTVAMNVILEIMRKAPGRCKEQADLLTILVRNRRIQE